MALLSESVTVVNVSTDEYPNSSGMMNPPMTQPDPNTGSITVQYGDGTRLVRKVAHAELTQYVAGQTLTYSLS